jgi:hypothetical protein
MPTSRLSRLLSRIIYCVVVLSTAILASVVLCVIPPSPRLFAIVILGFEWCWFRREHSLLSELVKGISLGVHQEVQTCSGDGGNPISKGPEPPLTKIF